MIRTLFAAALLTVSLVGCADDPTGGGGLPINNKPDNVQVGAPSTNVDSQYGEQAGQETRCGDCTIIHDAVQNGYNLSFVDNTTGDELCTMHVTDGAVVDSTCDALGILPPAHL